MSALLVMSISTEVPVWSGSLNLKKALSLLLLSKWLSFYLLNQITSQSTCELNCFPPLSRVKTSPCMYLQIESEPVIYLIVCSLTDWKGRNLVRDAGQVGSRDLTGHNKYCENSHWAKMLKKLILIKRLYEK